MFFGKASVDFGAFIANITNPWKIKSQKRTLAWIRFFDLYQR